MSIRNARNFDYSSEGARSSMHKDTLTRLNLFGRIARMKSCESSLNMSKEERQNAYGKMADEAFDEEE